MLCLATPFLASCATVVATAGGGMAENLNAAIMNQDDPELVRDGAPAYLLMLDSFVEGAPGDPTDNSSTSIFQPFPAISWPPMM